MKIQNQNLNKKDLGFKTINAYFCTGEEIKNRLNTIPQKFRDITLTGNELAQYEQCLFKSCYIYGSVGTGKTTIARKLQELYITLGYYVQFVTAQDIVRQNENYYKYPGDYSEPVRKYTQKSILIIDDIGATLRESKEYELLLQICDFRYDHELPTIFTSNLAPNRFDERLSDRIFGITEIAINLNGTSKR